MITMKQPLHHHHHQHHDSSSSSSSFAPTTLPYEWNLLNERRPSSRAIAIQRPPNQQYRRGEVDYSSSTYESVMYDLATWRMYHRILEHRRQRSSSPEVVCVPKKKKESSSQTKMMMHHQPPPSVAPGAGTNASSVGSASLSHSPFERDDYNSILTEEGIFQLDL